MLVVVVEKGNGLVSDHHGHKEKTTFVVLVNLSCKVRSLFHWAEVCSNRNATDTNVLHGGEEASVDNLGENFFSAFDNTFHIHPRVNHVIHDFFKQLISSENWFEGG